MTPDEVIAAAAERLKEDFTAFLDSLPAPVAPLSKEPFFVRDVEGGKLFGRFTEGYDGSVYIQYTVALDTPIEYIQINLTMPEGDTDDAGEAHWQVS